MDNVGTLLRTIEYKGRTASLIIKVLQLSGVQKQVGVASSGRHGNSKHPERRSVSNETGFLCFSFFSLSVL